MRSSEYNKFHFTKHIPQLDTNNAKGLSIIYEACTDFLLVFFGFLYYPACTINNVDYSLVFSKTSDICLKMEILFC